MSLLVEVTQGAVERADGTIPVRHYRPVEAASAAPTFMWVHGGGFFRGDLDLPEAHDVSLALAARGIPVVSADYRLVPPPGLGWARRRRPSVRFPLPMEDVVAVMRDVSRDSGSRFVVGGASAGASLVTSALREAAKIGVSPRGAVLAYGFFHTRTPVAPDIHRLVRGHRRLTHSRWALDLANRNYLGSAATSADPRAFAGGNDLRDFPPTLMLDAERDAMRASGEQFAREFTAAGVALERHVLPGSRHAFLNRPHEVSFDLAIELMVEWIGRVATA